MNTPRNYDEAMARIARLETALRQIASFDDAGANERLAATGSYGRFDEPGSVQIARAALAPDGFRMPTREVTGETI